MTKNRLWIESAKFDISLFGGTLLISIIFIFFAELGGIQSNDFPIWAFLVLVVGFDVAHVYGTLYRVYMDKEERKRLPKEYFWHIIIIYIVTVAIYQYNPILFFTLLAYYALYHFIKQHYGFIALYKSKLNEKKSFDFTLDKWAVYTGTLYPVLWWHAHLPREFSWFMEGDFPFKLNPQIADGLFVLYIGILVVYVVRQVYLYVRERFFNPGKNIVMLSVWLSWYLGIIHFNNDFIWNAFIILGHAIPYFGIIWLYGKRKHPDISAETHGKWLLFLTKPKNWIWFYLFLFCIAIFEETLWDIFVWHEHIVAKDWYPSITQQINNVILFEKAYKFKYVFWIPLLALPQIAHFYLDGVIWRIDKGNPDLKKYLHLE